MGVEESANGSVNWYYMETPKLDNQTFQAIMEAIGYDNFRWIMYNRDKETHQACIMVNHEGREGLKRLAFNEAKKREEPESSSPV